MVIQLNTLFKILILFLFSSCAFAQQGGGLGMGVPNTRPLVFTPEQVFNITDYGAKCDGSTNDNTAINNAFAAAAASSAYTNNNAVKIVGPAYGTQRGCVINSINGTLFTLGTGANTRPRVEVSDMTLLCTGAGNICLDFTGSKFIKVHDISIRGDTTAPPEICIQFAMPTAVSAAWNSTERVNCNNEFSFTALYNFGSEANLYLDSVFANAHSSNGPIGLLGAITGGSGCTNGTFAGTALTGGTGSGAIATITILGNTVTGVTITYQGRDYTPNDTLSAAVASCSGFSVPVSTVTPYAIVMDGQNYWRASSAFTTVTNPVDTWQSLTLVSFINSHGRMLGSGQAAMWAAWTGGMHMYNSYLLNNSGSYCMILFDNGVTKSGIPGPNWGLDLDYNCEGASLTSMFNLSGANNTPNIADFTYRGYHLATQSMFSTASNITGVTVQNADFDLRFATNVTTQIPMFSSPKLWTLSGRVWVQNAGNWNAPAIFNGTVGIGAAISRPNFGPIDLFGSAAMAVSCARQLSQSYSGPLCQVTRSSDSTTIDLYPDGFGNLDRTAFQSFCNGTTCSVSIWYDQSGNGNNCVQSTAASQPALTLALSGLGNKAAALFGDQSAKACTTTAAASINDLFATGGYATSVVLTNSVANQADRLIYKSNGGNIGWELRSNFVGTSYTFTQQGWATTQGLWSTSTAVSQAGHVIELLYSYASLANVPTISIDGTSQSVSSTQPVGTYTTDAAQPLLIGNNAATAGTRGYPGYIAEVIMWKSQPSAAVLQAIRRNQGTYYGLGTTVN